MKKKYLAIAAAFVMTACLAACSAGEETTLTGVVVSVDDTVISLMEMDAGSMGGGDFTQGGRPEKPEGMEGPRDMENFDPEAFEGTIPEGESVPPRTDGEKPEMPEEMTPPEGMTMPENGEMPDFGGKDGMGFEKFSADAETKSVDIGEAHISVEIDGGKASGSMEDIKAGAFVTVTINGKGQVTNVLVSSFGRS